MAKKTPLAKLAADPYERVGKLASLGIEEPWQAALYLPQSYMDATYPEVSPEDLAPGDRVPMYLTVVRPPVSDYNGRAPRLKVAVKDAFEQVFSAAIFGDTLLWKDRLTLDERKLFLVSTKHMAGQTWLQIHDLLPDDWAGRIVPTYPGNKNIIEPAALRKAIQRFLPEGIPLAAQNIVTQLEQLAPIDQILDRIGATGWTVDQLLLQAHYPDAPHYIEGARRTLTRLAALGSLHTATSSRATAKTTPNPLNLATLEARILGLPAAVTHDQGVAIRGLAKDFASTHVPCRAILSADVGCGKSWVIGSLAAAVSDAGGQVVILFPTTVLASQHFDDIRSWYPDLRMALVTGETKGSEDLAAPILIGTSALLHRKVAKTDVLLLDEQQKWSRAMRERCMGPGTHLVEFSATCIPRTMALMRFGQVRLYQMRQTHALKTIHTQIWEGADRARQLTARLDETVKAGQPVFIIYPMRERNEETANRHNVSEAYARWNDRFPGAVRSLTGDNSAEEMKGALEDIIHGRARILICTTVVEVGVNVPNLRHVVVVSPERHGLTALHQLRGRVARQGGEGWFDMLAPTGLPENSRERLDVLCTTTDGFEVAEHDLRLRGAGDLRQTSSRQSGADGNFLHGIKIPLEIYDQMAGVYQEFAPQAGI